MQSADAMIVMSEAEYAACPDAYRGVWTTEREDLPNWQSLRLQVMGKRTFQDSSGLHIEGITLTIR